MPKKTKTNPLYDLMSELQTWVHGKQKVVDRAREIEELSEKDLRKIKQLADQWERGQWDEDVSTLFTYLENISENY